MQQSSWSYAVNRAVKLAVKQTKHVVQRAVKWALKHTVKHAVKWEVLTFARRNSGGKTKKSRPSLPRALKKNRLQTISQNVVKTNRDNKNARYDDLAC